MLGYHFIKGTLADPQKVLEQMSHMTLRDIYLGFTLYETPSVAMVLPSHCSFLFSVLYQVNIFLFYFVEFLSKMSLFLTQEDHLILQVSNTVDDSDCFHTSFQPCIPRINVTQSCVLALKKKKMSWVQFVNNMLRIMCVHKGHWARVQCQQHKH